ncbi:MAG TPA: hypothetical protein PKD85_13585, partial [Saprospiraceae bacterium]|nr:hypothetical protein [Saprospiraceae bacterium]
ILLLCTLLTFSCKDKEEVKSKAKEDSHDHSDHNDQNGYHTYQIFNDAVASIDTLTVSQYGLTKLTFRGKEDSTFYYFSYDTSFSVNKNISYYKSIFKADDGKIFNLVTTVDQSFAKDINNGILQIKNAGDRGCWNDAKPDSFEEYNKVVYYKMSMILHSRNDTTRSVYYKIKGNQKNFIKSTKANGYKLNIGIDQEPYTISLGGEERLVVDTIKIIAYISSK